VKTPTSFLYAQDVATGVATITLNRPDRLNALTFDVYDELGTTFRALNIESGVRAIVITGAGKAFCSGGDVRDIIGALVERDDRGLLEFTRMTCDLILAIRRCRVPVVAALNGTTAGAGAVMATACDVGLRRLRRASRSSSRKSVSRAPTWAPPGCCRASWAGAAPPSC